MLESKCIKLQESAEIVREFMRKEQTELMAAIKEASVWLKTLPEDKRPIQVKNLIRKATAASSYCQKSNSIM